MPRWPGPTEFGHGVHNRLDTRGIRIDLQTSCFCHYRDSHGGSVHNGRNQFALCTLTWFWAIWCLIGIVRGTMGTTLLGVAYRFFIGKYAGATASAKHMRHACQREHDGHHDINKCLHRSDSQWTTIAIRIIRPPPKWDKFRLNHPNEHS